MWLIFPDRIDVVIGVSHELKTLIERILDRHDDATALAKAASDLNAGTQGLQSAADAAKPS